MASERNDDTGQHSDEPPEGVAGPRGDENAEDVDLDAETLDALLGRKDVAVPARDDSGPDAALDQASLDALLAEQLADAAASLSVAQAAGEPGDVFDPGSLDAQLAGNVNASASPEPLLPQEAERGGVLDQAALNALLSQQLDEGNAPPDSSTGRAALDETLDQKALDALLAGQDIEREGARGAPARSGKAPERRLSEPVETPAGGLPQPSPDAMLARMDDEAPLDNQDPEAIIGAQSERVTQDTVDEASIDALLNTLVSSDGATPAAGADEEGTFTVGAGAGPSSADEFITQDMIDALIGGGQPDAETLPPESPQPLPRSPVAAAPAMIEAPEPITQDMIDAIIGGGAEAVSSMQPAAKKAPESGLLLSQDDLEALIKRGEEEQRDRRKARQAALDTIGKPPAPPEEPEEILEEIPAELPIETARFRLKKEWFARRHRGPREPGAVELYVRENFLKVSSSIAALLMVSAATFTYLFTHQERTPGPAELTQLHEPGLEPVIRRAQGLIAESDYEGAIRELDKAIESASPSPELAEARFLKIDAGCRALPPDATEKQYESLHSEINDLVEMAPAHPRAIDALKLKAKLYEKAGLINGARDAYQDILRNYPANEQLDTVLLEAARIAAKQGRPANSAEYLQRLLQQFPGSAHTAEAKVLLGDALAATGNPAEARALYTQMIQTQAGTPAAARAYAQLGKLDYEQGKYTEAVQQLNKSLEAAAPDAAGSDEVHLLLAQAQRAAGRPEDARRELEGLLGLFPDSPATPRALVELSQVLDALGDRKEALRAASRATQRFPRDPTTQINAATLLDEEGQFSAAASAWMAAHEAGANRADVVLAAARDFRKADALDDAIQTYDLLLKSFPSAPEIFEGSVESAQTKYAAGRAREAIDNLESMAIATEGRPQRLPVLSALGGLYQELGLKERVKAVYSEIAALTTEPEALAQAATALWTAGVVQDALAVTKRVDLTKTKPATAYALLTAQGRALMPDDPRRALEPLEQASDNYPDQRTADGDRFLLDAYLATNHTARARVLVMELAARVAQNPKDAPQLEQAAVAWGDHLYERGDMRAAADAYAMAIENGLPDSEAARWAKYQRANALFKLTDFGGSVVLFDEVAATPSPWAGQAAVMAEHARIEQQLRGLPVTPPPVKEG